MFRLLSWIRSICTSRSSSASRACLARNIASTLLIGCSAFVSTSLAQTEFPTSRRDNARTNANTSETLLTPANVNKNSFGRLFSTPVDYVVMAQPLFMSNVNIPGKGAHNVVYVATQADSIYAIDADTGAQLWYASMLDGGTTASGTYLPCGTAPGFNQEGIVGTPVIDPSSNTMYLVAKTLLNTTVRHHLHAIDISTGLERSGSPVLIEAKSVSKKGKVTTFNSLHQKNRPGLLLVNGTIYMAFGSNYCNDHDSGWLLSYDASTLQQKAVFNTSPDYGLVSIWQAGNGPAADAEGNIYVETAESGSNGFDVPNGGQTYCNSVLKLSPELTVADYFTPWSVAYLNSHDLDLSSTGSLLLPDQADSPYIHEMVASGKQGIVYVLNRDNMGMYASNDSQIIQEFALIPGDNNDVMFGSPAYWNHTVYFSPSASPVLAFPLSAGTLGTPLKTAQSYPGSHSPLISSNGNTNGILWNIPGQLYAFDATSLGLLYSTTQAPNGRDKVPPIGHFTTPMVANGKVYVATNSSLEVFGLFGVVAVASGGNQSAMVGKALPAPIQVQATNPYDGKPETGSTVNFSDGGKGGAFNPASAVTDSNGNASTRYTVPLKAGTYTLTMSGSGFGNVTTTATAISGGAANIVVWGGSKQTGVVGTKLSNPLIAQIQDANKNGVSGVTVNFAANNGGIPSPASAITDTNGFARTYLQLPTTVATVSATASSPGLTNRSFIEYATAGPPAHIGITNGNNQSAVAGTQLPQALTVVVQDQYGNPVPTVTVTYNDGGAGGTFANPNPGTTNSAGKVSQVYTLPSTPGAIAINAIVSGLSTGAAFTETAK